MTALVTSDDFEAQFHRLFRQSVFRLETLQVYRGSGEDAAIAAFYAGHPAPPHDPTQTEWESLIRGHRRAGRLLQRVHVVAEPVSDYMRFELTWAYAPSVRAGEDIRIIPVTADSWPDDLPRHDFWLFDSTTLFDACYTSDGTWLGVQPVAEPARVVQARRWRDAALHRGQPWADYIAVRPYLAARLPTR